MNWAASRQKNSSKKAIVVDNEEPTSHHIYFDTPFCPETFTMYTIYEKHALDGNHNSSRINHFITKLFTNYPFLPKDISSRMERMLNTLHCKLQNYLLFSLNITIV